MRGTPMPIMLHAEPWHVERQRGGAGEAGNQVRRRSIDWPAQDFLSAPSPSWS
jgi:hypothetical protein